MPRRDALPPLVPQIAKKRDIKRRRRYYNTKYARLIELAARLDADEMIVVPRGSEEWSDAEETVVHARQRLAGGLRYQAKQKGLSLRVERIDDDRIGVSRNDV